MTDATPWSAGRLRSGDGPRLLFGAMHEDVRVEEELFAGRTRVFAVGSAGDTALTLARSDRRVVAVDVNRAQAGYVLDRLHGAPRRHGTADRLLDAARRLGPLVGWTPSRVDRFLALGDVRVQQRVFDRVLDTARLRAAFAAAFAPSVLLRAYLPAFVDVVPRNFGRVLHRRLRRGLTTHANRSNPYARLLLAGEPPVTDLPPAGRVEVVHADAVAYLEAQPPGRFDAFSLSNILDGPDRAFRSRLAAAVRRAGTPDAVVVVRTLREPTDPTTATWAARDRSLIWGGVIVAEAARFTAHVRSLG